MAIKKEPKFTPGDPLFTFDGLRVVKFKQRYQHFNVGEHGGISPEEALDLLRTDRKGGPAAENPKDPAIYEKARRQWRDKAGRVAVSELRERKEKNARTEAYAAAMMELEALEKGAVDDKGKPPEK